MFSLSRVARALRHEFGGGYYGNHSGFIHGYSGCQGRCRRGYQGGGGGGGGGRGGYGYNKPCIHKGPPAGSNVVGQFSATIVSITALSDGIFSVTDNKIEDPFVIVQLSSSYSRTRTLKGPVFGSLDWPTGEEMFFRDTLTFPVWESHSTEKVKFFVYGKKKHGEGQYLASASIPLSRVLMRRSDEIVLQLFCRKLGRPYGQIHVRLSYEHRGRTDSRDSTVHGRTESLEGTVHGGSRMEGLNVFSTRPAPWMMSQTSSFSALGIPRRGCPIIVYSADEDAFIAVPEDEGSTKGGDLSHSSSSSSSSSFTQQS